MNVFDLKHMSNSMDMLGSHNSIQYHQNQHQYIYHTNNINIQQYIYIYIYIQVSVNTHYYIYQNGTMAEGQSKFKASNVH